MRILYVTSSFPYGHGEGFLVAELNEIQAMGHEVVVLPTLARGPVIHEDVRPLLAQTHKAPLLSVPITSSGFHEAIAEPMASARSLAELRRSRTALILAKNVAVFPKSLWAARLARELAVEHIHAHWAGTSATIAMIASELAGIPWSMTVHRWDIREDNLLRRKADSAAFVRAISADGLADLRRRVGRTTSPLRLIHMGVPLPKHCAKPVPRAEDEPLRVLVPANLLEVKGHRYLVEAIGLLGTRGLRVQVALAGQGPLRGTIEMQIASLGLNGSCSLLGQLSHTRLLSELAAGEWDAVVMPSIETPSGEKEGIPVSLLEAMSYGVPVVGTRVGGVVELLGDGSGLLVPPADPGALAEAIETLASDGELRARLGALGRVRVACDFASELVVSELVTHFEHATATQRSRRPSATAGRGARGRAGS